MTARVQSSAVIIGVNVVITLLFALAFSNIGWHTSWGRIVHIAVPWFVISTCCCSLCVFTLPWLVPFARRWLPLPLDWGAIVVVLVALGAAGSLLGLFILVPLGYVRSNQVIGAWLAGTLKGSIAITLVFGLIGTAFQGLRARLNATTLALRTKERDEADARRIAAEAQLASLESRVQPHFLFNTLNSIAALIPSDPSRAEHMTTQLASLLRSSLDQRRPLVALDEELRVVRDYLDIERVRFGNRLRYDVSVDPATSTARVPRLSVQTLVENSVKYAVSPRPGGGSITVRTVVDNGRVHIHIADDGPGFDASRLPDGHGLALLRDRLDMLFGAAAALRIHAESGGTTITIDVPATD